jgi:L-amino acid N-acyltransferase YncA
MKNTFIRLATLNDAQEMLDIYSPSISDSAISFETQIPTIEEFRGRIVDYSKSLPWIVYEVDGRIAGYAYASAHRSRCAYGWSVESSVYVGAKYHGQGIGSRIYQTLFELLKAQGVVNIFAGITQPNEASVRLHESFGFTSIGEFKDVGFKLGKWWNVGWWQLQLQKPKQPGALKAPVQHLEVKV